MDILQLCQKVRHKPQMVVEGQTMNFAKVKREVIHREGGVCMDKKIYGMHICVLIKILPLFYVCMNPSICVLTSR